MVAAVLCGCAASSNTTSSSSGAAGAGPPSSTTSTTSSGATTPHGGPSALSVSPAVGSAHSVVRFSFTSPERSGPQGATQISDSLSVIGPHRPDCVGVHQEALPSEPAGAMVSAAVGPAQLGGPWCAGTYTARVEVVARPVCGPGMMCPQFIRVIAVLGPVTFRISG
jgi:hypothetical protein